ncbi:hypothetical protein B0T26DRAFT_805214 [Lasiosphaeria miniovina]|uniref:Uncharacterized protein n=1 Tax=Lasiosphaeria miniovina TaxID=1954250 RepID=A0AA40A572_9PEZI|nr:uncharacterized protein B0T26DRAFT_805214 [Lasiosphaeria miniovina]KAK0709524.1 hypothetical protein B0T26DRAFT_805214 [Lasiosphaeria miniovina]
MPKMTTPINGRLVKTTLINGGQTNVDSRIDKLNQRSISLRDWEDELDQKQQGLNRQANILRVWETDLSAQSEAFSLRLAEPTAVRMPLLSLTTIQTVVSIQPVDGVVLLTGLSITFTVSSRTLARQGFLRQQKVFHVVEKVASSPVNNTADSRISRQVGDCFS